jgi:hypothetical protein
MIFKLLEVKVGNVGIERELAPRFKLIPKITINSPSVINRHEIQGQLFILS